MTIPDEVERAAREPSDAELADHLNRIAVTLTSYVFTRDAEKLRLAAQRLEARGEISEAMVERAARAGEAEHVRWGIKTKPYAIVRDATIDPVRVEFVTVDAGPFRDHYTVIQAMKKMRSRAQYRDALEAALSGKEE